MPTNIAPLAVTIGEPAGIGPDIILSAWLQSRLSGQDFPLCPFYVLGNVRLLQDRARLLGLDVPVSAVEIDDVSAMFATALPVLPLTSPIEAEPGNPQASNSAAIVEAITTAVEHLETGRARAMVTAPINKKALYDAGFNHPGHTEFLAELAQGWQGGSDRPPRPVMMLAGPRLRAVPVTIHIPLAKVAAALTAQDIIDIATITAHDLQTRFAIPNPRLVISGLNPHAGEEGAMGQEDAEIIAPAVAALQAAGIDAKGPLPADTMFHARARAQYDVAICMYHDQALIPAKALDFDRTVNVTLGLPFVRTSPDHGTAYDIAGSGKADPTSMIAAVQMADEMTRKC